MDPDDVKFRIGEDSDREEAIAEAIDEGKDASDCELSDMNEDEKMMFKEA